MREGIAYTGIPSAEELKACPGVPSEARMAKGAVAVIECTQCIPCNPCEKACPAGAISVGSPMTNRPVLDEDKCVGCGRCIASCPGLAITVLNQNDSGGQATLDFPYEYLPLPQVGDTVQAADRAGCAVCQAEVLAATPPADFNGVCVLRIAFPRKYAAEVKTIQRLVTEG